MDRDNFLNELEKVLIKHFKKDWQYTIDDGRFIIFLPDKFWETSNEEL